MRTSDLCAAHPEAIASLTSLSLTHVMYPHEHGLAAKALAYITLTPLALLVVYGTLTVARSWEPIWPAMMIGQLLNEGINAVLKHWIQEHRPTSHLGKGYGMPSSHAQFMAYFAMFALLLVRKRRPSIPPLIVVFICSSVIGLSTLVCYSRIFLQYHTSKQVLAGVSIGVCTGTLWFYLVYPWCWPNSRISKGKPASKKQ